MTISTSKKVATARAKPTVTKSSEKKLNQQTTKNTQSQASVSSSHSQTSRHISVSDEEDEEPTHVDGILDVDSNHIMEPSDSEDDMTGTSKNPTEIGNMSEDEGGKEDKEAELCKSQFMKYHQNVYIQQ